MMKNIYQIFLFMITASSVGVQADDSIIFDGFKAQIINKIQNKGICPEEKIEINCINGSHWIAEGYSFFSICRDIGVSACGNRYIYMAVTDSLAETSRRTENADGTYSIHHGEFNAVVIQSYIDNERAQSKQVANERQLQQSMRSQ